MYSLLTETGGISISPQPGPKDGSLKPGCPMRPFFGVEPVLTNEEVTVISYIYKCMRCLLQTDTQGEELEGNGVHGLLCLRNPTPGMCRRIIGLGKSLKDAYFNYFNKKPGSALHLFPPPTYLP